MTAAVYDSDLVTDEMVAFEPGFIHALLESLRAYDDETQHIALYLLLSGASWDKTILDMTRSFLVSLVKEGVQGLQSNIDATGVFIGSAIAE